MALVAILTNNFSAGELSETSRALTDVTRYQNGAKQLENWRVLVTGGVTRRAGTRYVATEPGACVLHPFQPTTTDAYVLAFSDSLIRFYKDTAYLSVSLASPYTPGNNLYKLRTAQLNDVMVLVHGSYAPRRLIRTAPTTFTLTSYPFDPPPTYEAGYKPGTTLTLSATSGSITLTAGAASFMPSDVQRTVIAGTGRAVITVYTSTTAVTALVLDTFDTTSYSANAWTLRRSPVATLTPSGTGPVGAILTVKLGQRQDAASNLVATDLTTWSDFSATGLLASGTHDAPANSTDAIVDLAVNFISAGVLTTHVVLNVTDGGSGIVTSVSPHEVGFSGLLQGGSENDFDIGDTYNIVETGAAKLTATRAELSGGTAGHGWIEDSFSTTAGLQYQVRFRVGQASLSAMVGSASTLSDLYAEASFLPREEEHSFTFTATGSTSYLGFRNNQNSWASVSGISVRVFTIDGFRSVDLAKYLRLRGGLLKIGSVTSASEASVIVVRELSDDAPVVPGAWSLEEPMWSDTLGWPKSLLLYESRLYFGGTATFPQTMWGSAIDSYSDFFADEAADDAVEFSIVDSAGNITLNVLDWLMPAENILTGTSHGEYRLIGSGDDAITAQTPPRARIQSSYGSDDTVMPVKIDQGIVFAQRMGSKIRKLNIDESGATRFLPEDLSILASHLFEDSKVIQMAYQAEPIPTLWNVRADGVCVAMTHDTREEVKAWWRFVTAFGAVASIAVIPHPSALRHQVWMAMNRFGSTYMEVMDEEAVMSFGAGTWKGLTVDSAVIYDGAATNTITGLGHLNGQTVTVVAGGTNRGTYVPSGGSITVTGAAFTKAFAGLAYGVNGETLPPDAQRFGTLLRSKKHYAEITAMIHKTLGMTIQGQDLPKLTAAPVTGDVAVTKLGWNRHGRITFTQDEPYPATLLGLVAYTDLEQEQDR